MDLTDFKNLLQATQFLRASQNRAVTAAGLPRIHFDILDYLARANRFSNNLLTAVEYLGLTKGTVSQSMALLSRQGLIEKQPDPHDRRRQSVIVTPAGRALIDRVHQNLASPALAAVEVSPAYTRLLHTILADIGNQLQRHGPSAARFGSCRTCRHRRDNHCALHEEAVTEQESALLCRYYKDAA